MKYICLLIFIFSINIGFSQSDNCNFIYGKESSKVIFSGTVKKIRQVNSMGSRYEVVFKVDSVYKGHLKYKVVYTSTNALTCYRDKPCYLCGFNFRKGKRYVVYVCGEEHELQVTNRCTFTQEIKAQEEVSLKSDLKN
ncbi:MAG: hypothetical protein EOP53_04315 [Sphingobacteriales bacterium]|nr:MAG: hypothetical protein EOP53_04315 [Sphingobacteriales bacterium]